MRALLLALPLLVGCTNSVRPVRPSAKSTFSLFSCVEGTTKRVRECDKYKSGYTGYGKKRKWKRTCAKYENEIHVCRSGSWEEKDD